LEGSAYTDAVVAFGNETNAVLSNIGCRSVLTLLIADNVKNQDVSLND